MKRLTGNPAFEWTLRQADSITPAGFSATMRGNLSSELMVSSWGGKRIIRGVVFKYRIDPDHYYFLYKEPHIRSSDPYRVAEATTGLTLGTPGKMKTVIRDAEERIRKFIAEHGKAKYDSLISSAEKLNHVEGGMVLKNPPFYAHNLYEKKTHGLNLKQMRRLYAMVSRGNQKAITYARNVLGIPFSESPTQVKAVVYHHVRDLAEKKLGKMSFKRNEEYAEKWLKRRLRGNPFGGETLRSFKQKYKGFEIIVEIQPNTILATWTNGDILESDRFSGYELDEIFEEVKARIDALKRRRR